MNIDDMPAGREMDALVAEKVMGRKAEEWTTDGKHLVWTAAPYSTDIAVAWEVFELITRGKGYYWVLTRHGAGDHQWQVENEMKEINVVAETAPLAICRAALKAVGV